MARRHIADLDEYAHSLSARLDPIAGTLQSVFGKVRVDTGVRQGDAITPHYDPAIAAAFKAVTPEIAKAGEQMLWAAYDRIQAPTLLLRGADSDLLSPATAQAMTERGPRARLLQWPGYGHAPTLTDPVHIDSLANFLLDPAA